MKQFYFLFFGLFLIQFSFGQIGFYEKSVANDGLGIDSPTSLFVVDIDGDGDLDVVAGSTLDNKVVWYENSDGQGNFGLQQTIATNQSIYNVTDVIAVDMDNDGDTDILSASSGDNKIALYRNIDGQGNFGSQEIISNTATGAQSIHVSDIDGDGDLDLISKEDDYLVWYENTDGLGTFGESINIVSTQIANGDIVTSDIDGDGDLDVIARSSSGYNISWYENTDGNGSFIEHLINNNIFDSWQVLDLDTDGDMDIVGSANNRLYVFKNSDGQGNFISTQIENSSWIGKVFLSDFDSDGAIDIILPLSDRVVWYKNLDGLGNFGDEQFITSPNNAATELVLGDADNDGDNDLFFISRYEDKVGWYKNIGVSGDFWEFQPISRSYIGVPNYATAADMDGDEDLDILCAASDLSWYENLDGQGNFGFKQVVGVTFSSYNSYGSYFSEAVDIDNDGDLDILSISSINGYIVWLENLDGLGNFGPIQAIDDINSIARNVKAADFDGDGDLDVICASWANSTVAWYENVDGLGDFGDRQVLDATQSRHCLPADIDGDGDLDILIARNYELIWLENLDGQGNFGETQLIASGLGLIRDFFIEDIDLDGDIDIFCATDTTSPTQMQASISWFENLDGLGDFGEENDITTSFSDNSIDRADLDNDGDLDIISGGYHISIDFMGWFENIDGQGNFNDTRLAIDPNNVSKFVRTADIDGDGDIDIVSGRDGRLSVYENLGILGNEFNGTVRLDLNEAGCNNGDQVLNNVQVTAENGNQSFSTFTIEGTGYQLPVNEGNFITSVTGQLPDYYTVNPISYTTSFMGMGNVENLDFCVTPNGVFNDLSITIYPSINDPRPGFNTTYRLVYSNIGTTQLSGTVSFEFNGLKLNFLNASETVSSQTANTLNFDFTDLNPFETRTIDLQFNVFPPPTTNIDDVLISTAAINPVSGDNTEEDNTFTLNQTVIGSYDPNDITCLEGDEILLEDVDKYLHYIIRFQNTGTASSINVRVENVLDDKLDWTTMQLESLSHNGRVEILNGSEVSFIFNNINLPDSTSDEPNSHGFIAYKIKPKTTVAVGDIMYNTANIFFDFNTPITTNTVSTEIVNALSIDDYNVSQLEYFPNPVKDVLRLKYSSTIEVVEITDILGNRVYSNNFNASEIELDLSELATSLYFVTIKSENNQMVIKILKD